MKHYFKHTIGACLLLSGAVFGFSGPVIISDGPSEAPTSNAAASSSNAPSRSALLMISDGPGTSRPLDQAAEDPAPAKASADLPDTQALAPAIQAFSPAQPRLETRSREAVSRRAAGQSPRRQLSGSSKRADYFYVYSNKGTEGNHFTPSGWIGDHGDIRFDEASTDDPHAGRTCIKVTYSAKASQGAQWAGMYWQSPANNWGDKTGGFDLSDRRRLTFWARGAQGGEVISEFRMGGIQGEQGDSDSAGTGVIVLSREWQKYTVGLGSKDLTHIIGGFSWTVSRQDNPEGLTMYLDDIRYE